MPGLVYSRMKWGSYRVGVDPGVFTSDGGAYWTEVYDLPRKPQGLVIDVYAKKVSMTKQEQLLALWNEMNNVPAKTAKVIRNTVPVEDITTSLYWLVIIYESGSVSRTVLPSTEELSEEEQYDLAIHFLEGVHERMNTYRALTTGPSVGGPQVTHTYDFSKPTTEVKPMVLEWNFERFYCVVPKVWSTVDLAETLRLVDRRLAGWAASYHEVILPAAPDDDAR